MFAWSLFHFTLWLACVYNLSQSIDLLICDARYQAERLFQTLSNDSEDIQEFLAENKLLAVCVKVGEISEEAMGLSCWEAERWGWV